MYHFVLLYYVYTDITREGILAGPLAGNLHLSLVHVSLIPAVGMFDPFGCCWKSSALTEGDSCTGGGGSSDEDGVGLRICFE